MSYTHTVTVPLAWEEAVQRTREALAGQGSASSRKLTFERPLRPSSAPRPPRPPMRPVTT